MEGATARPTPLVIDRLTVRYGERVGIQDLTLVVRPGEIYGLLGSNGAGKSTTMKTIVGLQRPDSGSVRVFGFDPTTGGVEAKQRIGYVPETPLLFDALTPWEFLEFVASVRRMEGEAVTKRAARYAEALQLTPELHQPIATLSMGNRQKVLLVAALLHRPPLLVLDEPFHSLDPRAVRIARDLLRQHASEGRGAVLISTHTMEVAERLCDRAGILDRGRLVGEGTISELQGSHSHNLEEAFLKLTREDEGVRAAVESLGQE
ncbi:MAG: ABC transporter ATP-binding protein [Thermoplasmata archaeon]|nr:ABC transporter ATP-binding protein [Thermoplasmata archaeon]MCI4359764.1 ABC transporter ATP-binding protein [Thermoplasmata archaeon]